MERWYIGFNTRGTPYNLVDKLTQAIKDYRLGDFVVRFCYEKGMGSKSGQHYFFIGVTSEQLGVIPDAVYNNFYTMLSRLNLRDMGIYVTFDNIKPMTSKEYEAFNLRQIKMLKWEKSVATDPFDYASSKTDEKKVSHNPAYDKLLYWLSLYGQGSWQQFQTTCKELGIDSTGEYSRRIARRLRSLGHIEMNDNGQRWFITPPCLVQVENGDDSQYHTFLAGQRSQRLLEALHQAACVTTDSHPYGNAPEIINITFNSEHDMQQFVREYAQQQHPLHLVGLAGLKIASLLPDLHEWEHSLPPLAVVKGNYHYQQWVDGRFIPINLPKETGLYQLTHVSDRFEHPQLTLFYNAENDSWKKADWYGLRYLMYRRTGRTCEVIYDHNRRELAMELDQRWPDLYERALVLASGKLPIFRAGNTIFSNIPENLAHLLANKLEADFMEYRGI
jgi:hypothetical protein